MASRARHFRETDQDGGEKELSLLSLARTVIVRLDCLRPDLQETDADKMLTSLAQFDLLFNLAAIGSGKHGWQGLLSKLRASPTGTHPADREPPDPGLGDAPIALFL